MSGQLLVSADAVGLRLFRIVGERLVGCEAVRFVNGARAVDTTLRRAKISGRVEINGKINDHFADVLNDDGDMIDTVALDQKSYAALKGKWMRCKVDPDWTDASDASKQNPTASHQPANDIRDEERSR